MMDKKEMVRYVLPPQSIADFKNEIEDICFRSNDTDLTNVNTIFVFGSTSNLKNMKNAIQHILNFAKIKKIIITGGISKKTTPLSEARVILNCIQDILSSDVSVVLEENSTNTKENVLFAMEQYPEIKTQNICFVCKYHAAGRCFLTLKKLLQNAQIKQYAFISNDCVPNDWIKNIQMQSLVWGEFMRIFTYGRKADIAYDEIKQKIESVMKNIL